MENYAGLKAALVHWLNREGFASLTDQAELLVAMAQRRIHEECDLNAMETVDSAFSIDGQAVATPAGFLRTKSIFILQGGVTYEVEGAPVATVMRYHRTGRPNSFCVIGDSFYFNPVPDATYTAQLIYYKALDILSESNTTNWISTNRPELLLFSALLEASYMLKDDARAAVWEKRYEQVKLSLRRSEDRMDKPSGGARVRLA